MYTPLVEPDDGFVACGTYPTGFEPALRVVLAKPHYLLAMKLQALASIDRGERDLTDARALAAHLGLTRDSELHDLYRSIYDDEPPPDALPRFGSVIEPRRDEGRG